MATLVLRLRWAVVPWKLRARAAGDAVVCRARAAELRVRDRRRRDGAPADDDDRDVAPAPLLLLSTFTAVPRRTRRLARFSTPFSFVAGEAFGVDRSAIAELLRDLAPGIGLASPQSSAMDRRMARKAARRDAVWRACRTSGVVVDTLPGDAMPVSGLLADQSAGDAGAGVAGDAAARSADDPRALFPRDARLCVGGVCWPRDLRERPVRPDLYGVHSLSLGDATAPRLRR